MLLSKIKLIRVRFLLIGLGGLLLPLIPLLNLEHHFPYDWENHVWLTDYYRQYFLAHGSFPDIINTTTAVGLGYSIFYGVFFYPLAAVFSIPFVGTDWGLRLFLGMITLAQYFASIAVVWKFTKSKPWSIFIGSMVIWSTYSLTNIYNRGATTEYAALSFLHSGLCLTLLYLRSEKKYLASFYLLFLGAAAFMLAAGTHPITALYGAVTVVSILPVFCTNKKEVNRLTAILVVVGLFVIIPLSHWIYLTLTFSPHLKVVQEQSTISFPFPKEAHLWWVRLFPIPFDLRAVGKSIQELKRMGTPYLDTQINIVLGALSLSLGWLQLRLSRKWPVRTILLFSFFLICFYFSVAVWPWLLLPQKARMIQFPYRLTGYCNVFLFACVIASLSQIKERIPSLELKRPFFGFLLALGVIGVAWKIPRSMTVLIESRQLHPYEWQSDRSKILTLPPFFYGVRDYSTPELFAYNYETSILNPQYMNFTVNSQREFGNVEPMYFQFPDTRLLGTNMLVFPWNELYLDGSKVNPKEIEVFDSLALIHFPQGAHSLEYRFSPDKTWVALKTASMYFRVALFLLCLLFIGLRGFSDDSL